MQGRRNTCLIIITQKKSEVKIHYHLVRSQPIKKRFLRLYFFLPLNYRFHRNITSCCIQDHYPFKHRYYILVEERGISKKRRGDQWDEIPPPPLFLWTYKKRGVDNIVSVRCVLTSRQNWGVEINDCMFATWCCRSVIIFLILLFFIR